MNTVYQIMLFLSFVYLNYVWVSIFLQYILKIKMNFGNIFVKTLIILCDKRYTIVWQLGVLSRLQLQCWHKKTLFKSIDVLYISLVLQSNLSNEKLYLLSHRLCHWNNFFRKYYTIWHVIVFRQFVAAVKNCRIRRISKF